MNPLIRVQSQSDFPPESIAIPGQSKSVEIEALMLEGQRLEHLHDYFAAIEIYSQAIELAPANALAFHRRGWAKAATGDILGEIEDWTKAVEIDPLFDAALADRAVAKVAQRDYSGAQADAAKAISLNPELSALLQPILDRINKEQELRLSAQNEGQLAPVLAEMPANQRREFLKNVTMVGLATLGASLASCSPKQLAGKKTDVRWGMIIDLKRCVGCKACTVACKVENHTPPGVAYNMVLEQESGTYPYFKKTFLPRPCMQCENSSCSMVCPVSATFAREDGIVVIDYDKCIGCRYCIAACPYGARSFDYGHNYSDDLSNPWEQQASPEYGQQRKREAHASPEGNVRKCTFCLHRIYNGLPPACVATCMGNAIFFGNLADPEAKCMVHGVKLHELLATRSHMRLKEDLGNEPRVYYLT